MNYRKFLLVALTFIGGIYFFLEFVLPEAFSVPGVGRFEIGKYHSEISDGYVLIGSMAVGLGIINILMVYGSKLIYKRKGAFESGVLIAMMFAMIGITSWHWYSQELNVSKVSQWRNLSTFAQVIQEDKASNKEGVKPVSERIAALSTALVELARATKSELSDCKSTEESCLKLQSELSRYTEQDGLTIAQADLEGIKTDLNTIALSYQNVLEDDFSNGSADFLYKFLYEGLFIPLGSAMFSLLGFYIISAGYRAFRIKSLEAALMMIAALLVMIGQIPFYQIIHDIWASGRSQLLAFNAPSWLLPELNLPYIRYWILQVPNAAAFRAISFGAGIAGLIMAFRIWFSIESTSFSDSLPGSDLEGEG